MLAFFFIACAQTVTGSADQHTEHTMANISLLLRSGAARMR